MGALWELPGSSLGALWELVAVTGMRSLAWDDPGDKKDAHNAIRTSTPDQVIDLPKPPDYIIVDIKLTKGIKWPHYLNLSPNSNLI